LKWDQALYSTKLISEATRNEAFSPAKLNSGMVSNYGFGWDVEKDAAGGRIVQHTGDNPGYRTIIVRCLDQRKTIIILNNNAHDAMMTLTEDLKK